MSMFFFNKGKCDIFVLVYVDDIIVASSSREATAVSLKNLEKEFALKDLGDLHYFPGIQVDHGKESLRLTPKIYAAEILQRVGMVDFYTIIC